MRNVTLKVILLVAVLGFSAPTVSVVGQEYKAGDKVVALRNTVLKVGTQTVATVRRGQILTIGQVQGDWLWIGNKTGPDRLSDCLPLRDVTVSETSRQDAIVSVELSNPLDGKEFAGYSKISVLDRPVAHPVRRNARWGSPSGEPCRGWIASSSVARTVDLRVQGDDLYFSVADVVRLTRRAAPKDGLWPFSDLHAAIIEAERDSSQKDAISGVLYVQPVAVKQPTHLDLRAGRYGVFLVATPPDQSPIPGSDLVVVGE
jgi:hypothetical protein